MGNCNHPLLPLVAAACGLFVAPVVLGGCGSASPGVERAQQLIDDGDYAGAERVTGDQLARDPAVPALWHLRIEAALRAGQPARAVALYREWHELRRHYDLDALRAMAVTTLEVALRDADPDVRVQAIAALEARGLLGPAEAEVAARLEDPAPKVAAMAAVALLGRRDGARRVAERLAVHGDEHARAVALGGLARHGKKRARPLLRDALDDPSATVRRVAASSLARNIDRSDVARLLAVFRRDDSGPVRAAALRTLARSARSAVLFAAAREAMGDEYLGVRLAAVAIYAAGGDEGHLRLSELADGDDLFVALRASVALRTSGWRVTADALGRALEHRDWTLRAAAVNAAAEIVPESALDLIGPRLLDEHLEVRLSAARVLVRYGKSARAAETYHEALGGADDSVRVRAAVELVRIDDPSGTRALVELGESDDVAVRRAAAAGWRYTGDVMLPMVAALGDDAAAVRVEAADALLYLVR